MKGKRWSALIVSLLAFLVGLVWIVPFMGVLMSALRPQEEILYGWWNLPATFSFDNFVNAWNHPTAPLSQGVKNSLLVVIPSTLIPVFIGALGAYGLERFRLPGRGPILMVIALLLAIPQQMVAVPLFRFLNSLGLLDTYTGLVLAHSAWALPWIIFFLRGYLTSLPRELEEAAAIDGANRYQTFFRIVLPLMTPALASVSALQVTWTWNDFFLALVLIFDPDKLVATQRIPLMRGQYHVDWGLLSAGAVITMIVPILVFLLLQRYYIRGLIGGAAK
ncbi:carbohydrate ABC transporter permease [Marinithermus hydrothermalis]|uniref:ABC-type transporter, integral membrane subunit n=1 Tax=Marinithermus hydrothermalis (strain DSM 14884 / JCM 11576 / T1) TaxID=869210 RepID=F2NMA3_MARHT|nr:carbohydrate ABC transporter permease [Marinithermus hydrothermalis]AEB11791.1 ABC-type transporter, integral membrane subunit [Marinithermus hydrothermalis DSM 14884]